MATEMLYSNNDVIGEVKRAKLLIRASSMLAFKSGTTMKRNVGTLIAARITATVTQVA
jgi:hypothetical protein